MVRPSFEKIDSDVDHCLVLMPADHKSEAFYKRVLGQVIATIGLVPRTKKTPVWTNEAVERGRITNPKQEIDAYLDDIVETKVIIADVTGRDPDVFFGLGLAHAMGKRVIYVTRNRGDVPFGSDYIPSRTS